MTSWSQSQQETDDEIYESYYSNSDSEEETIESKPYLFNPQDKWPYIQYDWTKWP